MTELAGAISSGISLGALFSICMEAIRDVKIAQTIDLDIETSMLRIGILGLRLSRWGAAIHIEETGAFNGSHEYDTVRRAFEQLSEVAIKTQVQAKKHDQSIALCEIGDLSSRAQKTLCGISEIMDRRRRKKRDSEGDISVQITGYALYTKDEVDKFISDISKITDILEDVFPSGHTKELMKYVSRDVAEISRAVEQSLGIVGAAIEGCGIDSRLEDRVREVIARRTVKDGDEVLGDRVAGDAEFGMGNGGACVGVAKKGVGGNYGYSSSVVSGRIGMKAGSDAAGHCC